MTEFQKWWSEVSPVKAFIGLFLLVATASFGIGVSSVRITGVPQQLEQLADTVGLVRDVQLDVLDRLEADSVQLWRIECIVRRHANDQPLSTFDCNPNNPGGDEQ